MRSELLTLKRELIWPRRSRKEVPRAHLGGTVVAQDGRGAPEGHANLGQTAGGEPQNLGPSEHTQVHLGQTDKSSAILLSWGRRLCLRPQMADVR